MASTASANGDLIQGVFNIDMIGYNNTGNHYYNIVSDQNSLDLGDDLVQANQVYQIGLNSNNNPFAYDTYSDHEQFWQYGYKAILLIENAPPWNNNLPWYTANPYYHKAQDTHDKVNMDQVAKITRATLAAVACRTLGVTSLSQNQQPELLPNDFMLHPNYPNPFNASTTFSYHLENPAAVELSIYDLQGRKLYEVVKKWQTAGDYTYQWYATDDRGHELSSGLYIARMSSERLSISQKIVLIK